MGGVRRSELRATVGPGPSVVDILGKHDLQVVAG